MTTLIAEEPLERLNYFNGQRLEAGDLRVEQDYHMRVRRLLNQALYTPGIASGLEVGPADNPHAVRVSPGVALDALGREVILLEETEVPVRGLPNTDPAWVYGNFLYVRYAEGPTAALTDGCALSSGRAELAWGGPTRIRATPELGFADTWPDEGAGQILLAQVELGGGCAVAQIRNQARKYVDSARSATRTMSYEGEKDIALSNSKKLSFHVMGGPPSAVTLYLWGEIVSPLLYSQLAPHRHSIPVLETGVQLGDTSDLSHEHEIDLALVVAAREDPVHGADHDVKFPFDGEDLENAENIRVGHEDPRGDMKIAADLGGAVTGGAHTHPLTLADGGQTLGTSAPLGDYSIGSHHHVTVANTTGATGQGKESDVIEPGRTGRLGYLDDLRVYLNESDITDAILAQLGWDKLGDGTSAHRLQVDQGGTGAIALERIAALGQGEHTLEFLLENDSGGNLRYNLYVE